MGGDVGLGAEDPGLWTVLKEHRWPDNGFNASSLFVLTANKAVSQYGEGDVLRVEKLELVAGDTVAITMRTPGHDRELALGFLFAEGIVRSIDDVSSVAHCGSTTDEGRLNTIDVTPAPGVRIVLGHDEPFARRGTISSACGVCGRRSIDDLLARCTPVTHDGPIELRHVLGAVEELRVLQPLFGETGGCHGAALISSWHRTSAVPRIPVMMMVAVRLYRWKWNPPARTEDAACFCS